MADYLRNFIASAADTGAKMYAEQSIMNRRAEIQSRRDDRMEKLQRDQMAVTADFRDRSLEAQTDAAETTAAFRSQQLESQTEDKAVTAQYNADRLALEKLKATDGGGATANQRDVKAMVASGYVKNEAAAWEVVKGENGALVKPMLDYIIEQQEFTDPSMPSYIDPKDYVLKAKELAASSTINLETDLGGEADAGGEVEYNKSPKNQVELGAAIKAGMPEAEARAIYDKLEANKSAAAKPVVSEAANMLAMNMDDPNSLGPNKARDSAPPMYRY